MGRNGGSGCLHLFLTAALATSSQPAAASILEAESYAHYAADFNRDDDELFQQHIPNAASWAFLKDKIPLLDVPDKDIEKIYYFRWWTYRKHIKKTPDGFIITEFLPPVPWAGKYNSIPAPAAHHIREGRWLSDPQYVRDYLRFWLKGGGTPRRYSFPIADALYQYYIVTGDRALVAELLPLLVKNYRGWETEALDPNGLFWQEDGRDGMEVSICGSGTHSVNGYRATINSYMYGDARAIAKMAALVGEPELAADYGAKARTIKANVQSKLWDASAGFFKVLPKGEAQLCDARELHGYTPWYFSMPDARYSTAWKLLMDPRHFRAPFGPTSADQAHPGFQISYQGHECQWNGPSWPFATSITLTAAANLLNDYTQSYFSKADYLDLLKTYTSSHQMRLPDGRTIPWIDENLNPFTGDWISRTRLKTWENGSWSADKGGPERGKDYNHSTYADLVINGLIGLRPQENGDLVINPLVPAGRWDYFALDKVPYRGRTLSILYDKTGRRYQAGRGMMVFVDGKRVAKRADIGRVAVPIDAVSPALGSSRREPENF